MECVDPAQIPMVRQRSGKWATPAHTQSLFYALPQHRDHPLASIPTQAICAGHQGLRTYILAAMVLAGITQLSLANLKIPRSVYQVEDMEEAMATATEKEKPLIFVFTDPGTT